MPPFSLAYLSTAPLPAPDALILAATLGYQHIGIRLTGFRGSTVSPMIDDRAALRTTARYIRSTGVTVLDAELIRIGAHFSAADHIRLLDAAASLGARALLVLADDTNQNRLVESFASLCEACDPLGLSANLEFMPGTGVPNVRTALTILKNANRLNGKIVVDILHVARSQTQATELSAIPDGLIEYIQICDAPPDRPSTVEAMNHAALCERNLPGEGGLNVAAILRHLPRDRPIGVEVPNKARLSALGAEEWARQALAAAKKTIELRDEKGCSRSLET